MTRQLAGIYAAGSTFFAMLAIVVASSVFGLGTPPGEAAADGAGNAATVTPSAAGTAYSSTLGELEAMRRAALNDVAAQVAAQRAALQEQAIRDVETQRAGLQAQALSELEAQRAAAQQSLAADIAAGRAPVQAAQAPAAATTPGAVVPLASTTTPSTSATASPAATPRPVSSEAQSEIAKKTAECDRKKGEDRNECLREVAKLRARYGL